MIFEFYVDFLRFVAVGPVEYTAFARVCFKDTFLFALGLDDLNDGVGLIYDHVPWLELNNLAEAEWRWQVLHVGNNFVHAVTHEFSRFVLENDCSL